jgi:methylthioribose-1-phosphate isomerase
MNIDGQQIQSISYAADNDIVSIIDQTALPHRFDIIQLDSLAAACHAIVSMQVRGAPLIGVTAGYGMYLALRDDASCQAAAHDKLLATRPTAVNLQWALARMSGELSGLADEKKAATALVLARQLEHEDIACCEAMGEAGAQVLKELWHKKGDKSVLNVLTHCNAGALATVDWGTALAVVYKAAAAGVPIHVWVDETRPRNQGASLTCWELGKQGIPHTLIVDNAGGHLMQHGQVDVCVVGSDRTTIRGDVCNKIGTYLKALAAKDNDIPFYVALPASSIDFTLGDGLHEIPIEERGKDEVSHITGLDSNGELQTVEVSVADVAISNYGFDVTPARLVSGLITEYGVLDANEVALQKLQARL